MKFSLGKIEQVAERIRTLEDWWICFAFSRIDDIGLSEQNLETHFFLHLFGLQGSNGNNRTIAGLLQESVEFEGETATRELKILMLCLFHEICRQANNKKGGKFGFVPRKNYPLPRKKRC